MQKFDTGTRNIAGAEALDIYVSNAMTKGTDIERNRHNGRYHNNNVQENIRTT
jgi:hypothetical protein